MDKFKAFIQENKPNLDVEQPDDRIWDQIQQNIVPEWREKNKKVVPFYRWAAAACLLLLLGAAWFFSGKNKPQDIPTYAQKNAPVIEQPDNSNIRGTDNHIQEQPDENPVKVNTGNIAKTEKVTVEKKKERKNASSAQYVIDDMEVGNFSQVIAYERQYINTLPIYGQQPAYFNDFKQQLTQMDADERNVRSDIKKHGLNGNQIELLINIYQQKITLLKQLNQEINRINKSYYQNHLQDDSAKTDHPYFMNI